MYLMCGVANGNDRIRLRLYQECITNRRITIYFSGYMSNFVKTVHSSPALTEGDYTELCDIHTETIFNPEDKTPHKSTSVVVHCVHAKEK